MRHLLPLLLCLVIAASSVAQEAQYDEKMGLPAYPYKSFKEYIPVLIARLADTSIMKRVCGPDDEREQPRYKFFSLCMTAQDFHRPYVRQSKETGEYSVFVDNNKIYKKEDKAVEIRDWLLKKKNGLPVTYAAYTQVSASRIQYFVKPLALKSERNTAAKFFLNYAIEIDYDFYNGTKEGMISYWVYPLHHPQDLADGKEIRGFPDYISLLNEIISTRGEGNYARIKSNYERKELYHLIIHSPDVVGSWVSFSAGRPVVVVNIAPREGTLTAQFDALAAELKSAKWPVPFAAKLTDDAEERRCQFAAPAYPITFSLVYRKHKGLLYLRVEPS